jgi:hypothetical protein
MRALCIIALGKFHSYTAIHIHIILCNHIEHFKRFLTFVLEIILLHQLL